MAIQMARHSGSIFCYVTLCVRAASDVKVIKSGVFDERECAVLASSQRWRATTAVSLRKCPRSIHFPHTSTKDQQMYKRRSHPLL